jgi:SAM-dependent methyltransferase
MKVIAPITLGLVYLDLLFTKQRKEKEVAFERAKEIRKITGKPIINVGCGNTKPFVEESDVNIDKVYRNVPNFVLCDIEKGIPFPDKYFGVAFCSHVIEHLNDPIKGIKEIERVSDYQIYVIPKNYDVINFLTPFHKWIVVEESDGFVFYPNDFISRWALLGGIGLVLLSIFYSKKLKY